MEDQTTVAVSSSWKTRQKRQLRDELISAALQIFEEKGLDAACVDDIVGRVGVAKGTFYLHFKAKTDLVCAVVEEAIDELGHRVSAALEHSAAQDAPQALHAVVKTKLAFFHEHSTMMEILLSGRGLASRQIPDDARD